MTKKRRSFGEKTKQRSNQHFVGRDKEIEHFKSNLNLGPESDDFINIFNIFGQSGVGKSELLERQYQVLTKAAGYATAFIDLEDEKLYELPAILKKIADQLDTQDGDFKEFIERHTRYQQASEEIQNDPARPRGTFGKIVKQGIKTGAKVGKELTPGGGLVPEGLVNVAADLGSEWVDYIAEKFKNKDDKALMNKPVEVLSPLWLKAFYALAEKRNIGLLFDTFETANPKLIEWLFNFIDQKFGEIPDNFILAVAGQSSLASEKLARFKDYTVEVSLDVFSEEETRVYLRKHDISSEGIIKQIIAISNCLPVYLSLLTDGNFKDEDQILDPNEKVVGRFLRHIKNPVQEKLARNAALARKFNKDIVTELLPKDISTSERDQLFEWLKKRPFVKKKGDRWAYHSVVQQQMGLYQQQISEKEWEEVHFDLSQWYKSRWQSLEITERDAGFLDERWLRYRLEEHFHLLSLNFNKYLPDFIRDFVSALRCSSGATLSSFLAVTQELSEARSNAVWMELFTKVMSGLTSGQEVVILNLFEKINSCEWLENTDDQSYGFFVEGLLNHANQKDKAIAAYEKAIEIKPENH
ncbi:MAG: hypothetical protein Roseis2KO_30360 [Roseivirga sp.]